MTLWRFSAFCVRFCYSPSSNTILLSNSHQFIHKSREEREREGEPGERTKRLIEVVLCNIRYSGLDFLIVYALFEKNFCQFSNAAIDFTLVIDRTFVPFPGDLTNRSNYIVNEKRAYTSPLYYCLTRT